MNMLFWIWYKKHREELEEENDTYNWDDIDQSIPNPVYGLIGILSGVGLVGVSWLIFRLLVLLRII